MHTISTKSIVVAVPSITTTSTITSSTSCNRIVKKMLNHYTQFQTSKMSSLACTSSKVSIAVATATASTSKVIVVATIIAISVEVSTSTTTAPATTTTTYRLKNNNN